MILRIVIDPPRNEVSKEDHEFVDLSVDTSDKMAEWFIRRLQADGYTIAVQYEED